MKLFLTIALLIGLVGAALGTALGAHRYRSLTERQLKRMDKPSLIEQVLSATERIDRLETEISRLVKEVDRLKRRTR